MDPRTECAFRNVRAFKVIREAYYTQIDSKVARGATDGLDPAELEKWIPYRAKVNSQKAAQTTTRIRLDPASLHLAQIKVWQMLPGVSTPTTGASAAHPTGTVLHVLQ